MKNDNREYPPRLIPKGIKSDRSNTVVITKKMYDLKYKPTKPLKTLDQDVMSPNSTITYGTRYEKSPIPSRNITMNNSPIQLPNILPKSKKNDEDGKQSKNMTSAKLQELSLQYDMSRREIYEMHSTWHSMLEFTSSFLKRKG